MSKKEKCIFCHLPESAWILESSQWFVVPDKFPVSPGHMLLIPKNHRDDYFELTESESIELNALLHRCKKSTIASDPTVSGFNIGANCGQSAGQTVFHCHIHLIPRRSKDVEAPEGGVRGVIPAKQKYDSA